MDRIYRIEYRGTPRHAVVRDGVLSLLTGDMFGAYQVGERVATVGDRGPDPALRLFAPVEPSKIVAIGLNYRDHALEQGKPLPKAPMIFLKPSTSVVAPGEPIQLPRDVGRVDHEAEMGVVIGRRATQVSSADARDYILGLTCVNDVTARDMQNRGVQYSHVKGFDTFAPVGPCVAVGLDPADLAVEGSVNGVRRQSSRTRELIFSVAALIEYISAIMTLLPGDIISTGTPSGIGPLEPGDRVTVTVEGVGELTNPVQERSR
jgi:2-keto-4-pentenoate hydratase/2-oxohepta-3-ene-1,7-dioic acid hydratase in catechol pathway